MTTRSYQRNSHAVAYLRCSTDEQRDSGLGLEAQRQAITDTAAELGLPIRSWHADEGLSGGLDVFKRPGLKSAIGSLKRGDILLVSQVDRLGRDMDVVGELRMLVRRRRATIQSAMHAENGSDDSVGIMTRRMQDLMNEQMRLAIKQKTRAALQAKRKRGEAISRFAPFGWREVDGFWIEDRHEQRGLDLARELRKAGHSLRDTATILLRRGYRGRSGRQIAPETLRRALLREEGQ